MAFDPTQTDQRAYNGYGPALIPDPRDDEVGRYVDGVVAGGPSAVTAALATATEQARRVLLAFAERSASIAVRRNDKQALVRGVVATVLGGLDENSREALMVMAPLEDAARRLGLHFPDVCGEVAEVVGHPGTVNLMLWCSRKPEDRTLASMAYVTRDAPDGFRYHLDW
jgi:hypothetical protein